MNNSVAKLMACFVPLGFGADQNMIRHTTTERPFGDQTITHASENASRVHGGFDIHRHTF